ncbi:MAG: DUF4242 domain-containing protein [Actinomycetes bacterium]
MRKYVIERNVPGAGGMTDEQLAELAGASNEVLRGLGPDILWIQSQVVDDKIYCLYAATSEALVREHARLGGFPAEMVR